MTIAAPIALAAKPKKKPGTPPPAATASDFPSDANAASLRVGAMQTLYELDASPDQIRAIQAAAQGLADPTERPPAKESKRLMAAVIGLRDALLTGGDDQKISEARNALADASADAELDDVVHPSPGAHLKAATLSRTFSAGQLAAYLAAHADQVVGPGERLMSAVTDLHDDAPEEADAEIRQVASDVGQLVGGSDAAQVTAATAKAADWLRANRSAPTDSAEARAKLELSAKAAVGDVPPVEVLGHWFEDELAQLLANPQMPEAAAALISAREKDTH